MTGFQQRLQLIRGCAILLAVLVCGFLWISLLSFDARDWPSPYLYPHPEPSHNAAGRAGAWVAYRVFLYFGKGAYAALVGLTLALAVLARQGRLPSLWQRVLGIALLIVVASTAAHMWTGPAPEAWPVSRGGVLGFVVATWLLASVKWMTIPVLAYCLVAGLLFTSEGMILRIPAVIRKHRDHLREIADGIAPAARRVSTCARPVCHWLGALANLTRPGLPAASTGGRQTSAPKLAINPGRLSLDVEPAEDVEGTETEGDPPQETIADETPECGDQDEHDSRDEEHEDQEDVQDEHDDDDQGDAGTGGPARVVVNFPAPPKTTGISEPVVPPKPYPAQLGEWRFPPVSVLDDPEYFFSSHQEAVVREKARILERTLQEYRVEAKVVEIDTGPVITMFEVQAAAGVKVSQITCLANDIARALRAPSVRVVAPIPGKNTIGIEVPNVDKEVVRLKELITIGGAAVRKMTLPLYLGKNASGQPLLGDLAAMPHMLIAGTTGSGKSVCINSIITSLLMTQRPDMVKLILVDPKMVEMSLFRDVPHLMCPIVTEVERAEKILEWATVKMDERYALFSEASVRDIASYNRLSQEEKYERFQPTSEDEKAQIPLHLPYVVILIDELADLMMMSAKEVELHLSRLAQKSRAVGIHIIVATQRPEARIVTGLIKSNLPCRIAFRVASRMDSRIVLDQNGAEVLMGQGDMLYLPAGSAKVIRAQGTYLHDSEIKTIIDFLRQQCHPEFHPELMQLGKQSMAADGQRDELFDRAVEIVLETRRGSVSLLQRRLTVGYSRASRLIEEMAAASVVGAYKGSQAREVLITPDEWQELKEQEASRLRAAALEGDGVPDMLYDDDV